MGWRPTHLRDTRIDSALPAQREAWATAAARAQVAFACDTVPFWSNRLQKAGIKPERIGNLQDFAQLPPLSKEDLR